MTKQLTIQEVEAVVESIKNPNPILQCPECNNDCIKCTECNSTVWKNDHTYVGTVLEKMQNKMHYICSTGNYEFINGVQIKEEYQSTQQYLKLLYLWSTCVVDDKSAISRSLQEIIEASSWEETTVPWMLSDKFEGGLKKAEVLTSPEANALFTFLQEIL